MKNWIKQHIFPGENNNYQPTILQKTAMGAMLGLVLLSFLSTGVQSMLWTNVDWMVSAVLPAVIVEETNSERGSTGALRRNAKLDAAATMKANHMAQNGYFSHYSPDGTSPWYWFNQAGYEFLHAGENLAVHFTDSKEIVDAWMNSPTHRANIMNGQFTEIGIGVARGEFEGSETIFVVQFFGTPKQSTSVVTTTPAPTVASVQKTDTKPKEQPKQPEPPIIESTTDTSSTPTDTTATPKKPEVPTETTARTGVEVREEAATAQRLEPVSAVEEESSLEDSLYTETVTTSTEAFVGSTDENTPRQSRITDFGFLTSPTSVLQVLYILLGVFIALALGLSLIVEARKQHPIQVAYSAGLAVVMLGLFYLHSYVTAGIVIA